MSRVRFSTLGSVRGDIAMQERTARRTSAFVSFSRINKYAESRRENSLEKVTTIVAVRFIHMKSHKKNKLYKHNILPNESLIYLCKFEQWSQCFQLLKMFTILIKKLNQVCRKQTIDSGTVRILGLLQSRHRQSCLNSHIGKLVGDADQHGLVDVIKEIVVNLGILCHTSQQLVDQLAHTKTHCVAVGFVGLTKQEGRIWYSLNLWGEEVPKRSKIQE